MHMHTYMQQFYKMCVFNAAKTVLKKTKTHEIFKSSCDSPTQMTYRTSKKLKVSMVWLLIRHNMLYNEEDSRRPMCCTWSVEKLALSHVCNIKPLEQQNQVAKVLLHYSGTTGIDHLVLIHRLRIEAETQTWRPA